MNIRPWLIPTLYALCAIVAGLAVPRLSNTFLPEFVSTINTSAAMSVYSAIASGMISLTAIVFSLAFLMVQFSATVYSPRLVLWIARDSMISHALGTFTATFAYALTALAWVDRSNSGRVSSISLAIIFALLVASIAMFIGLIVRIAVLQVNRILIFIGERGREIIGSLYRPITSPPELNFQELHGLKIGQTLLYHGNPKVVQAIKFQELKRLAIFHRCAFEVPVAVGDSVFDSTPYLRVRGSEISIPVDEFLGLVVFGDERTFEQDPSYALRLLVDVSIRALSPAINDPTTAVQALDQIEDLLIRLGKHRLEIGIFHDDDGEVRVIIPFPRWEDFLRIAFDEIRFYGSTSVQVMRRMNSVISELISVLPEERHAALRFWQGRLRSTIDSNFGDAQDRIIASTEDHQGLGVTRSHTDEEVCV